MGIGDYGLEEEKIGMGDYKSDGRMIDLEAAGSRRKQIKKDWGDLHPMNWGCLKRGKKRRMKKLKIFNAL